MNKQKKKINKIDHFILKDESVGREQIKTFLGFFHIKMMLIATIISHMKQSSFNK